MVRYVLRKSHPSDLLVLAGEDDFAAVPVEGGGQDELRQSKVDKAFPCADVPDANVVVAAAGQEDILSGGMPHHNPHSSLVEVQVDYAISHCSGDAAVGDLPHLDCTVLGSGGDDIVIVGTPGDVQHRTLVTGNQGHIRSHTSSLGQGKDEERTSATRLNNHSKELGVDGGECRVPARLAHPDIVVAFLSFLICAENVAEF